MDVRRIMRGLLNYYWRIAATGICFALFGLGGLLLSITVFPLLHLVPLGRQWRTRQARALIHHSFRLFVWFMQFCGVLRVTLSGTEKLQDLQSCLVIANHPTLIDVVILISLIRNCDCVVKQGLWRNPFLLGVVSAANYISNSDSDRLIDACADVLSEGGTLIVFPEGTRSVPGAPLKFRRGAANMAVRSRCDVVPVSIRCTPPSLMKGQRWYQVPRHSRVCISVSIGERFAVAPVIADADNPTVAARRLNSYFETYYSKLTGIGNEEWLT
jgi:1-acyl-sn-glycerol-3-phosphate acyltransferase